MHHAPATARAPRVCTLVPFILFRISPKRMVLCSQLLSLCRGKKFFIPNSNNFGASNSEVAVAAPPWLSSESEDNEPPTHTLEVDVCVMAMENVYLQRSKHVPYART